MKTREKIVLDAGELEARVAALREAGRRVVLTNGAFDLLHVGHVRALEDARGRGDVLVVALNGDASVRRYKGPGRPLVPEAERAELMAALACVDLVTVFHEDTADRLLSRLRPDVYAKGRDYGAGSLPEEETARRVGCRLAFVGDPKTHAASDVIRRVRELLGGGSGPL